MLSEHYLLGNLQALAATGTPAPPLGRVDAEELRIVERDGGVALAIRAADRQWVVLADDDAGDASTIPVPDVTTVCVIGTRAGKRIDDIEARRSGIRIVAIEPDPTHALILLSSRDCRDAITSGRLVVLIGPDYPGASSSARRMDTSTKPLVLTDPLLAAHREASTRSAHATLERMLSEARANDDARRAFAPRYLLQTLQNLPVIAREGDTAALDRRFAGIPAVIVGAGPSLDEHLPELRRLSDRCLIVAADTALAPLETAGITAPVVVGVDPSEWNARHLAAPRRVDDTWLVAEGSLHPSVFTRFAGRTFTFEVSGHEPWPWFRTHGLTRGRLRAWGSVITSAFDLALRLGCDPIVFAGPGPGVHRWTDVPAGTRLMRRSGASGLPPAIPGTTCGHISSASSRSRPWPTCAASRRSPRPTWSLSATGSWSRSPPRRSHAHSSMPPGRASSTGPASLNRR